MRSIELFTGAGGLAIGTHKAGYDHLLLVEKESNACNTLKRNVWEESLPGIQNWENRIFSNDVREISFESYSPIDLVAGGPPCQPFSIGGKHRGMKDDRDMIPQFIRAIGELRPRAFIMENVKGLLRQSFQTYFSYAYLRLSYPTVTRLDHESWLEHLSRLEDIHTRGTFNGLMYNVVFRLLNAADYGTPQTRERVFLIGFRSDLEIEYHFPNATHSLDRLLYDQWVTGAYWERNKIPPHQDMPKRFKSKIRRLTTRDVPEEKAWVTVRDGYPGSTQPKGFSAWYIRP